jgi:hypothetical protein
LTLIDSAVEESACTIFGAGDIEFDNINIIAGHCQYHFANTYRSVISAIVNKSDGVNTTELNTGFTTLKSSTQR